MYKLRLLPLFGPDLDLLYAMRNIPAWVTHLGFYDNDLFSVSSDGLAQAFAAIPESVTSLDLSSNLLDRKTGAELAHVFAAIPKNVTSLDLSWNSLGRKTGAELALMFAAIPKSVTSLNLCENDLNSLTFTELVQLVEAIPDSVTSLKLSNLGKTVTGLARMVTATPKSMTALNLSNNKLHRQTGHELAHMFATIPDSVTSLNLSSNQLCFKTAAELALAFAVIPKSVTYLDLGGNKLGQRTPAELAKIVAAIPAHIKTINLENNGLFINKSPIEKDKILKALGNNRECFILRHNGESDLARALAPMVALKSDNRLPSDVAAYILSFIPSDSKKQHSYYSYAQQLKSTVAEIEQARKNTPIRNAANRAIDNYLSWSKSKNSLRGPNGFFTWLRHGQTGRDRAAKLRNDINLARNDPTSVINEFLNNPKTRYHRHSLASFLLDELATLKDSPWENMDNFPAYKR